VDKAESEPELAMAINGAARECWRRKRNGWAACWCNYSTDYVYDGTKQGAYVETDATNPPECVWEDEAGGDEAIRQWDASI